VRQGRPGWGSGPSAVPSLLLSTKQMRGRPVPWPRHRLWLLLFLLLASCGGEPTRAPRTSDGSTRDLSWTRLPDALSERTEVAAAAAGNRIYVAGGFVEGGASVPTVEVYDVAGRQFTKGPDLPISVNHAMAAAEGDTVYVFGGYTGALTDPSNRAFALRPGSVRWEELPRMPEPRAAGGAAAVNGKVYIAGGIGPRGLATSTLVYDARSQTWSTAQGLATPREHLGVAGDGKRVYVVGGRITSNNLSTSEAFDPVSGEWTQLPDLPTARGGLSAAATSNGLVVAVGGEASETFEEAEAFDTSRGRWIRLPGLPTPRHGLGVAAVGSTIYVVAGGPQPGYAFSAANEAIDLSSLGP
jgi:N-acetylneuraminic acid mutarotase